MTDHDRLPLTLQGGTWLRITHTAAGTDSSVINAEAEATFAVDAAGHLILSNRNGSAQDLGTVKGTDGKAGTNGTNGQGFTLRGAWAANTAYAPFDVVTNGGSSYVAPSAFTSGSTFNSSNWLMLAQKGSDGSASSTSLSGLTDTAINNPLNGHVLTWNNTNKWTNTTLKLANHLSDVVLTNVTNGQVLVAKDGGWVNGTVSGGGGGVSGPTSSTQYGLAMFSDATGQVLADSLITTTATGGLRVNALPSGSKVGSNRGNGAVDLQAYRSAAGNIASGQFSVLISYDGQATGDYSAALGGKNGAATSICAVVVGGTAGAASGAYSTVVGGFSNTASGDSAATVGGRGNLASGINSVTFGGSQANARRNGQAARSNQGGVGEMQWGHMTLGWRSNAALNGQELTANGTALVNGAGATANRFWLLQGMQVTFRGIVQATTGGNQYEGASWLVQGTAMCSASGVAVSGVSITPVGTFAPGSSSSANWSVSIQGAALAGGAGYLQFLVTNGAPLSNSVRWLASLDFVEITN